MSIKLHPIVIGAFILGVCLLAFLLIRGCNKADSDKELIASLQDTYSNLLQKQEEDSLSAARSKAAFEDSLSIANGQLDLKDNKITSIEQNLNTANIRIQQLLSGRTKVTPSDTFSTLVPNDFIKDCNNCFDELENQHKLVNEYMGEIADRDTFEEKITVIYNKRIDQLEAEKDSLKVLTNNFKGIAKVSVNTSQLRRTLYFTMGAIGKEGSLIMGVGAGLMYQDKKRRMFGATAYGTNQGTIYTGNLTFPLSFRRK